MNNVACLTTTVGVLAGAKAYQKVTGKAAGAPASLAHILTNENLTTKGKAKVIIDQAKEFGKDVLTIGGITAGAGVTSAVVASKSTKYANFLQSAKSGVSEFLGKCSFDGQNLKEAIKGTEIFNKYNALPKPAKVAIATAAAALAVIAPLAQGVYCQKAGYIEGKNETK